MFIAIVSFLLGLVTGLLVMRKHKAKADSLEAKGKTILDALKGK
jgi:type II secretory pathway pseudopilin PulG